MPCRHIKRLIEIYNNPNSRTYYGPHDDRSYLDMTWVYDEVTPVSQDNRRDFEQLLTVFNVWWYEMKPTVFQCSCQDESTIKELIEKNGRLFKEYERLANNSVDKNSAEKVLNSNEEKYNKLWVEYSKNVDDYNKLVGDHRELGEKCKNLIERLEEYGEYKEKFEEIRDGRERERIDNMREITTLRRDSLALQGRLTDTQQRLTASENKVLRIEERLETRNREVIELKNKLNNLSINVNNLEKSREELLNEKVNLKNDKLDTFANNSGIGLNEVNNLLRYYERLINARKNYNPINIETHEGNINRVKEGLRQNGVNVGDTQKCCRKCEKVAKLRIELNEIRKQQYEARQEVPPYNNNRN